MSATAVDVSDLRIELIGRDADVVDEITLTIAPGEVLGLVGESGSGKTTVGMALLGHVRARRPRRRRRGGDRRQRPRPGSTTAPCAGCAGARSPTSRRTRAPL